MTDEYENISSIVEGVMECDCVDPDFLKLLTFPLIFSKKSKKWPMWRWETWSCTSDSSDKRVNDPPEPTESACRCRRRR